MTPTNKFLMPALQFVAAVVVLALYSALSLLPMWGFKPADPATVETTKNVMMILVGYLFGSAVGSAKKDETISQLTKGTPT